MRFVSCVSRSLMLLALVMLALAASAARAQGPADKLYVVTHVDFTPNFAADGTKLLQQFAADSRKDPGSVRFELLQDNARSNHFTLVEVWQNQKAFEGHESAEHTKRIREKIQPMLGSPFDERLHHDMK